MQENKILSQIFINVDAKIKYQHIRIIYNIYKNMVIFQTRLDIFSQKHKVGLTFEKNQCNSPY